MSNTKLFKLAHELGLKAQELMERVDLMGYEVKSPFDEVGASAAEAIRQTVRSGKMVRAKRSKKLPLLGTESAPVRQTAKPEPHLKPAASAKETAAEKAAPKRGTRRVRKKKEEAPPPPTPSVSSTRPTLRKRRPSGTSAASTPETISPAAQAPGSETNAEALAAAASPPALPSAPADAMASPSASAVLPEASAHQEAISSVEDAGASAVIPEQDQPDTQTTTTAAAGTAAQEAEPASSDAKPAREGFRARVLKRGTGTLEAGEASSAQTADGRKTLPVRKHRREEVEPRRARRSVGTTDTRRGPRRVDSRRSMGDYSEDWINPPRRRKERGKGRDRLRQAASKHTFEARKKAIRIGAELRVSELASATGIKASALLRKLLDLGIQAQINSTIDGSSAELVASDFDVSVLVEKNDPQTALETQLEARTKLDARPPIVTIMGHVDHGKTSLLDTIRTSRLAEKEAGQITQHIGAYWVKGEHGDVVFLDTPGHEAFTSLRARGADVTDIVVLIVAADDGVMPQTIEAIEHAKAAGAPIIVAINKIDRPNADPQKVQQDLLEHGLVAEALGGDVVMAPISAKTGEGIPQLLEIIHLQAELMELKGYVDGLAQGYVLEARISPLQGAVATVLVTAGVLNTGDHFCIDTLFGRVRTLVNDRGQSIKEAGPCTPVEISGISGVPDAGDAFTAVDNEKFARQLARSREDRQRDTEDQKPRVSLEDFMSQKESVQAAEMLLVLKADTQGSLEALREALEKEGNQQVRVRVVRGGVGGISETDVHLAHTTGAIVMGFNVRAQNEAAERARWIGVDIKTYTVIYEMLDDVHQALEGLLEPAEREEVIGRCEVKRIFASKRGVRIAGGYVLDGHLERDARIRLYRQDVIIHTGNIQTLKRFSDEVESVQAGHECGLKIENFNDLKEGDLIENFLIVQESVKLERRSSP